MAERKLAHIEKVVAVRKADNSDNLDIVTILGWNCITKKDEFKIGDWCVYIEIDSLIKPDKEWSKFLIDKHNPKKLIRIKTKKLRGNISQGLCLPICILKEYINYTLEKIKICEGQDVTEALGITKYLSPSDREAEYEGTPKKKHNFIVKFLTRFSWYRKLTKTKSKSFPEWISKTDEERVQNMPWLLTNPKETVYYVTEKLDGQSVTYWYKHKLIGSEFGVCSRAVRKFEFDNSNWSVTARNLNIKKKLKSLSNDIAIQGEIIGPRIQGNKYKLDSFKLYVFNIYDIKAKKYYSIDQVVDLCAKLGLDTVPILDFDFKLPSTVDDMIKYAGGKSKLYDTLREGVVVRSSDKSISFKAINPEYLMINEY